MYSSSERREEEDEPHKRVTVVCTKKDRMRVNCVKGKEKQCRPHEEVRRGHTKRKSVLQESSQSAKSRIQTQTLSQEVYILVISPIQCCR